MRRKKKSHYELVPIQGNAYYDIDCRGKPVAHVARTKKGYQVVNLSSEPLAGPFKGSAKALKWFIAAQPSNP